MVSSERNKIALGVLGTVGVIFISYMLYKKYGAKSNVKKRKDSRHGQAGNHTQNLESEPPADEVVPGQACVEEDQNRISFVVLEQNGENQPASSKKSDKSSDESSFDVVEAEDGKISREGDFEESHLDDTEASVVLVESDQSGIEASSSSLYQSAEETASRDGEEEGETILSPEKDSSNDQPFSSPLSESKIKTLNDEATSLSPEGKFVEDSLNVERSKNIDESSTSHYTATASIQFNREEKTTEDVQPHAISRVISPISKGNTSDLDSQTASDDGMSEQEMSEELSSQEITAVLTACQNHPMSVTKDQIYKLVMLLRKNNPDFQPTVLDSLVRVSAFTQNNLHLRGAGCESVISQQVMERCATVLQLALNDDIQLVSLTKVLTNLSMDPKAVVKLEDCVSPLLDVLDQTSIPESVQQSILRPLINLSAVNNFHSYYIPAISRLYNLMAFGSYNIRLLSIKVLVNLSINETMAPQMLSAKAPGNLLDLLDKPTHSDLILRVVTLIGNLRAAIFKLKIDQSSLPPAHKAESPKTMYTAICGVVKEPLLRNKVYRLTRHSDEDIRTQASKLYTLITTKK